MTVVSAVTVSQTKRDGLQSSNDLVTFADKLFAAFDKAFDTAEFQTSKCIGQKVFAVRTSLAEQYNVINKGLSGKHSQSRADCKILVACGDSLGLPPIPQWLLQYYSDLLIELELSPTQYRVHHYPERNFWQFYCLESQRGVQLLLTPQSLPDWDSGSPLRNFLHWHLSEQSSGLVHAGVLGIEGRGVLLFGPGGSGKSGTVLAGILHGLQSVGDDYVLVKMADTVTAMPLFTTLKSDPSGLKRLGVDQSADWAKMLNWQGKNQFSFADITDAEQPEQIKIDALFLPQVALAEKTSLEPLQGKQAFLALAPTGIAQIPGNREQNFAFCAELSRRLPAYRVALGTDPVEIINTLKNFIIKMRG